ncbi:MAG: hypothetical protein IIA88_02275 [Bacteroidetes bacterium]|nr:hypothetical protein [Bacteroidota bacterium]
MNKQDNSYLDKLSDWYNNLEKDNLLLLFKGEFNQDFVKAVLTLTQQKLGIKEGNTVTKKRIMAVIIECLQNICKHGVKDREDLGWAQGIFLIGKTKKEHIISTGNYILNSEVNPLEMMLSKINSLDKAALNEMHKAKLIKSELSDKGGAGLGLITIAKKSQSNIEYHFDKIDNRLSFFTFEVKVST